MKGVQAWNYASFHRPCATDGFVDVIDFAGFKYVRCGKCMVLCNLDAVAIKYDDYDSAQKEVIYDGDARGSSPDNS